LPDGKSEIFLLKGLDTNLPGAPVGQISWATRAEIQPHERRISRGIEPLRVRFAREPQHAGDRDVGVTDALAEP